MACPTCSATMQGLGFGDPTEAYLCPRCGTVRLQNHTTGFVEDAVPALVERCREFEKEFAGGATGLLVWQRLGIREAIHCPEDRP